MAKGERKPRRSPFTSTQVALNASSPLYNPRQERFCQLVAGGIAISAAYASAGFEATNKPEIQALASRLAKKPAIRTRIAELAQIAAQARMGQVEFDRQRVINRLDHLSHKAEKEGKFAAAVRAEELIGKELGMFAEQAKLTFDGDLEKLSSDQMGKMTQILEQIAARRDPKWFAEYQRRKGISAPPAEVKDEEETLGAQPGGSQPVLPEPIAADVEKEGKVVELEKAEGQNHWALIEENL